MYVHLISKIIGIMVILCCSCPRVNTEQGMEKWTPHVMPKLPTKMLFAGTT